MERDQNQTEKMDDLTRTTFVLYPLFLDFRLLLLRCSASAAPQPHFFPPRVPQPDPLTQTRNKFDAAAALAVFITEHVPLLVAAWAAAGGRRGDYRIQSSGERD